MEANRRDLLKRGVDATLYPLPFKKGGKMDANSFQKGGQPVPEKPSLGDSIRGVFNREQRTQNRFDRTVNKAMTGGGSRSFKAASDFKLPSSGQTAKRGQMVHVTPLKRTSIVSPAVPATPYSPGTPASTERRLTGYGEPTYTPGFKETGAPSYGSPAAGAPAAGSSYNTFPDKMNPDLKAALQMAIANKQPTAEWRGKPYAAGTLSQNPQFEDVVTPGTPEIPGQPAIPAQTQEVMDYIAKVGSFKQGPRLNMRKGHNTVPWLKPDRSKTERGY